jgi:hypothetical protein
MTQQRENQAAGTDTRRNREPKLEKDTWRDREPELKKDTIQDLEPQQTGELIKGGGGSCACGGGRGD